MNTLELPFDVVYLIIRHRHLTPLSRMAFGLSCKAFLAALPATNTFPDLDK